MNKKFRLKLLAPLQNEKGVAIILAIFAMVLTTVIATEVVYESSIEYQTSAQAVNRLKAYYAAKAGVEISLYRILLYKKAKAQFGQQLKGNEAMLDFLWQFPMSWPMTGLDKLDSVDKSNAEAILKESSMDAQYTATIEYEGGKIDINDLGSPSKPMADAVRLQLLNIFTQEVENNSEFKEKYDNYDFNKLIDNIQDWVDEDNKSAATNGDESMQYEQPQDVKNFKLPPNSSFKTIEELHMVKGMEDEFFNLIKDRITVYGTKGINVNQADDNVLKALDPQIDDEVVKAIVGRRSNPQAGGPFQNKDDFYSFLKTKNVRTDDMEKAEIPLQFEAEYNFRIISQGQYLNVRRQIDAITYDIDGLTGPYASMLKEIDDQNNNVTGSTGSTGSTSGQTGATGTTGGTNTSKPPTKVPKGRPTVVFWQES